MKKRILGRVTAQGKSIHFGSQNDLMRLEGDFQKSKKESAELVLYVGVKKKIIQKRKRAQATRRFKQVAQQIERIESRDLLKVDKLNLKTVVEKVAYILRRNIATRDDDGLLISELYHIFFGAKVIQGDSIGNQQVILEVDKITKGLKKGGYPAPATIIRLRRHLQSLGYFIGSQSVKLNRENAAEKYQKAFGTK